MQNINVEIKAKTENHSHIRAWLESHHAEFIGSDHQIDTYFNVSNGRLKVREGTIECCIVWYDRPDIEGLRRCDYVIEKYRPGDPHLTVMKRILTEADGILVTVDKRRDIFFIGNDKFHLDTVKGLGTFFEIEAIGEPGVGEPELHARVKAHLSALEIPDSALIDTSYSDMLLNAKTADR